jgi:hypothetical protein
MRWAATPLELLEMAVESALRLRLTTLDALDDASSRGADRGDRMLQAVLDLRGHQPPTESILETRTLQLMRRNAITNVDRQVELRHEGKWIARVDFLVNDELVVQSDGRGFHSDPSSFENDRRQWLAIQASGRRLIVVTHHMIEDEPDPTARSIAALL